MITTVASPAMSGQEIIDLSRKHALSNGPRNRKSIAFQSPAPRGVYFYTPEGKRFIGFNSQPHVRSSSTSDTATRASGHQRDQRSGRDARLRESFHGYQRFVRVLARSSRKSLPARY